jgi:class 3 adenylate cyclase
MTAESAATTVLIVDIVHSTALYEQLGNVEARRRVGACLASFAEVVAARRGTVIKSMGDGLLCRFAGADDAMGAALAMAERAPAHRLEIRIGLQWGEVIADGDDIFGDTVNTASRVADVANPGEILLTRELRDQLTGVSRAFLRGVQPVSVKGKREPLELFAVAGDSTTGTIVVSPPAGARRPQQALQIHYRDRTLRLGQDRGEIAIGRDAGNDLIVDSNWTSRRHARIYCKLGKFVLVDQSSNGTFVLPDGQATLYLHREEAVLPASGRIYLGADPDEQTTEPIMFRLDG